VTRIELLAIAILVAGCAMPIGVKRMDPRAVHRTLTSNELTSGRPSVASRIVLQQRGLTEVFDERPAEALATLHQQFVTGRGDENALFALAELSFDHASHGGGRPSYLAAAVYAWAFLFPDGKAPDPFDPRLRLACDLYNRAVTEGFHSPKGFEVELRPAREPLPFGTLDVTVDPAGFRWGNRQLVHFAPVADLEVRGLRNRYRDAGIGAALSAGTAPLDSATGFDMIAPRVKVPVTAVLRIADARRGLASGQLRATLELHAASEARQIRVDGRTVPLEIESSSSLAYGLAESPVFARELKGFLSGDLLLQEKRTRLVALEPYRAGLIPVVLVHGTASSPGRWADMFNDLQNDPRIREHFQFWYFFYDTGNPIAYSSMMLRRALREAVDGLDPSGADACIRRMVVIGHSQGGLLTKMTAIDSGDLLWRNVSDKPLDELAVRDETKALLREGLFIQPLPFVRRLVFIATPHRGSFQARAWVSDLLARLVSMPKEIVALGTELTALRRERRVFAHVKRIPTSVENMSPANPFIKTLATIPVVPGVAAHSIIAVKGDGPPEKGNDGVVAYQSAHVDGVESELVVRSDHSTQSNPFTIEEVRRILLLHDAQLRQAKDSCRPGGPA